MDGSFWVVGFCTCLDFLFECSDIFVLFTLFLMEFLYIIIFKISDTYVLYSFCEMILCRPSYTCKHTYVVFDRFSPA